MDRKLGRLSLLRLLVPFALMAECAGAAQTARQLHSVADVAIGAEETCAIALANEVICWGGGYGPAPARVEGLGATVDVAGGHHHFCAADAAGSAFCWGDNAWGQLGNSSTDPSAEPVEVQGLTGNAIGVAAGAVHSCVLMADGTVQCWGANFGGMLGNDSEDASLDPVSVQGLHAPAVQITAADSHSCAVLADGEAKCWGYNENGRIGDGSEINRLRAVRVSGFATGAMSVSSNNAHTCGRLATGEARCWGFNLYGWLGIGSNDQPLSPVTPIGLSSGVVSLAVGATHACAVVADGDTTCWGWGEKGSLGNGEFVSSNEPVEPTRHPFRASQVFAGPEVSCAIGERGRLWCWGDNSTGRLGAVASQPTSADPLPVLNPDWVFGSDFE